VHPQGLLLVSSHLVVVVAAAAYRRFQKVLRLPGPQGLLREKLGMLDGAFDLEHHTATAISA
jgi:hypothetical protein